MQGVPPKLFCLTISGYGIVGTGSKVILRIEKCMFIFTAVVLFGVATITESITECICIVSGSLAVHTLCPSFIHSHSWDLEEERIQRKKGRLHLSILHFQFKQWEKNAQVSLCDFMSSVRFIFVGQCASETFHWCSSFLFFRVAVWWWEYFCA